jgi:tripartite ATP-independent transporter DctP family solute receptor
MTQSTSLSRRSLLRGLTALPAASLGAALPALAQSTPQYSFKYANNLPVTHPLNLRAQEVAARIAAESKGRMEIKIFPNNQLGGDTDMLSQVRSGGIEIFNPGTQIIATLAPISAITAVGFAFASQDQVWTAVDGKLGDAIRASFAKVGLHTFEKMWDNGFRQVTTGAKAVNSAADLAGMKIRVPVSPMSISLFQALGSAPTSLQFSEVYMALQTKVVDAQENPLAILQTAKLFEVQKYCALTNHQWDGYHIVVNGRAWRSLPDDLKVIVSRAFNEGGLQQRDDLRKLNDSLQADLTAKGMSFTKPSSESFRAQLQKGGYYKEWKGKFGDEAWALLESTAGKIS